MIFSLIGMVIGTLSLLWVGYLRYKGREVPTFQEKLFLAFLLFVLSVLAVLTVADYVVRIYGN